VASLPVARQKRLFEQHPEAVKSAGWGSNWAEVRGELRNIRHAGYSLSFGELDETNVGIAAPVFHEPGVPPAALIVVMPRDRYDAGDPDSIADAVQQAAAAISERSHARRAVGAGLALPRP
jgi:DNA-binding IclR family transcriptional regulator